MNMVPHQLTDAEPPYEHMNIFPRLPTSQRRCKDGVGARLPDARLPDARLPDARLPVARLPDARLNFSPLYLLQQTNTQSWIAKTLSVKPPGHRHPGNRGWQHQSAEQ